MHLTTAVVCFDKINNFRQQAVLETRPPMADVCRLKRNIKSCCWRNITMKNLQKNKVSSPPRKRIPKPTPPMRSVNSTSFSINFTA